MVCKGCQRKLRMLKMAGWYHENGHKKGIYRVFNHILDCGTLFTTNKKACWYFLITVKNVKFHGEAPVIILLKHPDRPICSCKEGRGVWWKALTGSISKVLAATSIWWIWRRIMCYQPDEFIQGCGHPQISGSVPPAESVPLSMLGQVPHPE